MENRMVEFVQALRASGVRVSVAESADAFRAVERLGVRDRQEFKRALSTTLVKDRQDSEIFERLFPLFFGSGEPPMMNPMEGMTEEEQQQIMEALRSLSARMQQLMRMLTQGQRPSQEQMEQWANQAGMSQTSNRNQQNWITRRMLRQMGFDDLQQAIDELMHQLAAAGMSQEQLQAMREMLGQNAEAMQEQVENFVGSNLERQATEIPRPMEGKDLSQRPFQDLSSTEAHELRNQVRRLAVKLRSRAALRQRRADEGRLDPKATIRASLRYGTVPLELHFRHHHLKPKLALICDVSTSMRPVAEFMLRLVYELSDQVAKARSFAFIDDINDISEEFSQLRLDQAVESVLTKIQPGYYNTDLGASLVSFCANHLDSLDQRTTVIIVGDGRNNFNDPRLDAFTNIKRHARRMIWITPEPESMWGRGDSDMLAYQPLCNSVHIVSNLADLAQAVDEILASP
ncbi:MAG: VWA domain-containing protein [Chloroflexi bacterium]|nr:VWA domain-containing protein [Chloroflexota bacterium]